MPNRTAIAIGSVLFVLAASACSSDGGGTAQQTPTTAKRRTPTTHRARPTTTRPSVPTTVGITVPPPPPLADLILGEGPPGFEQQSDDVGDTGPTNLAKATDDDISPDAGRALVAAGFQDGYQRQWTSVDDIGNALNQDFVFLYRFATPEGAEAFVRHWRVTLIETNTGGAQLSSFEPPQVPGGVGISAIDPQQGSTGVVLFSKGPYAVQALVIGGPSVDQSAPASDMAYAQYQRLP